jgi:hypothetical protein
MQGIIKITNLCKVVMIKRFSFAGASAAAIAFAVLCPSPARALTFNWTFTANNGDFIGAISGIIDGLNDNTLNNGSNSTMTATVTSDPFNIVGVPLPMTFIGGNGIQVTAGVVDTTGLQLEFSSVGQQLQLENPNGSTGVFGGYYTVSMGSAAASNDTSVPVFSAVPAPLPLLGLGAAAAFSRKLKQRIAMRRKRDEVGLAG